MFNISHKAKEAVGLDIGSYSIKVVSLRREAAGNTLTAYNIKNIPLYEKDIRLERIIEEALKEIDLHPEEVNLSISNPEVIVRFIDLPRMSREQLDSALIFEAEKYIPFDVNEVVMDFLILGDAPKPGQMNVVLAAVKRDALESRIKLVEDMGISVNVMDIDSFAVFNTFLISNPSPEKTGRTFLNLGHSQANVLITVGDTPCFMRQIQIGGKDIIDAICRDMGISPEKAEAMQTKCAKKDRARMKQATASVLDELVGEIQLSFGYFENRYNSSVSDIFCSGGLVFQEGITEYLGDKLGIPVQKWNPVGGIGVSDSLSREDIESIASQLAVSIGLALRD